MKQKQTAMKRLVVPFTLKANEDPASHTFEGLVAVIGQKDLGNDIIEPGSFKGALAKWKSSGDALPLLNSHDQYNIMSALGQLIEAKETKDGLWSKWEVIPGPEGDAVMARLTPSKVTGRAIVGKMSIGYIPIKWEIEQPEGTNSYWDQIRHLTEIDWKEGSLVLFPMAPGAAIDASTVKSFLLSAQATDGKQLDVIVKSELRKLATRIGILLKKQEDPTPIPVTAKTEEEKKKKKAGDTMDCPTCDGTGEMPGTSDTCETCDGSGTVPKKADPEHPGNDNEDDDDLDVVADLTHDPKKDIDPLDAEIKANEPYTYQEALSHRLQKTMLKHKVATIGSDDK
jgi:HK97 family phage prohead protease